MAETELYAEVEALVQYLAKRHLLLPAVLFLVGHRPLAFVMGQICLLGLPLALLFPTLPLRSWARVLSHPYAPAHLEARLRRSLTNAPPPSTGNP